MQLESLRTNRLYNGHISPKWNENEKKKPRQEREKKLHKRLRLMHIHAYQSNSNTNGKRALNMRKKDWPREKNRRRKLIHGYSSYRKILVVI